MRADEWQNMIAGHGSMAAPAGIAAPDNPGDGDRAGCAARGARVHRRCFFFHALAIVLLLAVHGLTARTAAAAYVIAPDIVQEYFALRHRVREQPNSADARFDYAVCLSYMGKVEESRSLFKQVRALDPEFAETALPRYLEQSRRDPANLKLKFRLGFLYYFGDKFDQALGIFREIADHAPAGQLNAWALGYMAAIKGDRGKWNEAEDLARQALRLEPDAYGLHAALAAALKAQGRLLAAVGEYLAALRDRRDFEAYEKTLRQAGAAGAAPSD
jgi:tetratricopeptide (TPR) repeat protein